MRRLKSVLSWLIILSACGFHAFLCLENCGGAASFRTDYPYLSDDHTLHYANALATRRYLADSGVNAGYDPFFMSGYAKSVYWPTNPMLEITTAALADVVHPARIYKLFVLATASAIPVAIVVAGPLWGADAAVSAAATVLWTCFFWESWPIHTFHYIGFGMSAFLASVGWSLVAAAAASRWLATRTWTLTICVGAAAGMALMAHPTATLLLLPPCAAAWIVCGGLRDLRLRLQTPLAFLLCLGLNYWWIVPLVTLRRTSGGAPPYFVNTNVVERLIDLVRPDPRSFFPAPSLASLLLLGTCLHGRRWGPLPPFAVAWLLVLSIPAGAISSLHFFQLGRDTLPLFAFACLPAAAAYRRLLLDHRHWLRWFTCALLLSAGIGAAPGVSGVVGSIVAGKGASTIAHISESYLQLVRTLRRVSRPGQRLVLELYEGGPAVSGAPNPYASYRVGPLIPWDTGLELIGGPYLATHYKTNFTQVGDGRFLGAAWERSRFLEHAKIYALEWAVLWSRPALDFVRRNPDLFEPVEQIKGFHLFRVRREQAPWEAAGLRLQADYDSLIVENPDRRKGTFVLPYHWTPGWTCENAVVTSTREGEDPVPFITIVDPPMRATLRFSPWIRPNEGASPAE